MASSSRPVRRRFLAASVATLFGAAAFCLPATTRAQSPIIWSAPIQISADTDVITTGVLVDAYRFGNASNTVVNGVTFTGATFPNVGGSIGNLSLHSSTAQLTGFTLLGGPGIGGTYGSFLTVGLATGDASKFTMTLNGLKIGTSYEFQWWYALPSSFVSTATAGNSVTLKAPPSGLAGQFDIGRFTATSTSETITFSGRILPGLNGFQLRDVYTQGSVLENAAPVNTPTFATFIVSGQTTTATPTQSNQINQLLFTPGGSLQVFENLFVTQGPVNLVPGSTLTLNNGNLWTNQLNVLGGLLNGTGWIFGNLFNLGTVSPGDAPGTIFMSGNYVQASGGLLQIQVGGHRTGQYSLLAVNGSATLGGALQLVRLNDYKLRLNEPITFLTATGGVSGRFASVENGFSSDSILVPTVVYHPNSVALEAVQGSFAQFADRAGLSANERHLAQALDNAAGDRRAAGLFNFLDYESLNKLPKDLERISPEELTSIFTISTAYAQQQAINLQNRTDDIRHGMTGFSSQRFSMMGDAPAYSGDFNISSGAAGPNGNGGKEVKETKLVAPQDTRWGVFLSGTGEWVNVSGTGNARGYDLASGGFTLGVDYKITPNFAIGLAAGYTGATADLTDHGRIWVNGGKLGLYSTVFSGGWYADMAGFGGYNSYDTRRSALEGDARGDTEGGEVDALFATGYDFKKGNLTFGPTASFNYTYAGTAAFTEHDSLSPLDIHGGSAESLRTALGVKLSYDWKVGGILIKPELRAAWQHEFGDAVYSLDSNLAGGAGSAFTASGPELGRDSALLGAGFAVQLSERCSTYLYYDGELGRKNYESNSVTGGLRIDL